MVLPTYSEGIKAITNFQKLIEPDIDYDILQLTGNQRQLEADNLELKVEQEANRLREEFAEAVGSANYSAARRGVKVGEGNIQQNIEISAGNVGKDIQTARGNVAYKRSQINSNVKMLRSAAGYKGALTGLNRMKQFADDFGSQKGKKKTTKDEVI